MLVAIYVRMSTDRQDSSIDRQLDQINKHVANQGYTVYKIYQDLALKGYDWERPAFLELMADAKSGRFHGILVDEESRFSRHKALKFIAHIAEPLSEMGVWLESVNEGRQDWDDMAGLIMTTIRAERSNSESSTLSRRVMTKWNMNAERGKCYLGRPPYGYAYAKDGDGNKTGLIPHEQEGGDSSEPAKIIRWLFDVYVNTDTTLRQLAIELSSRAIPTALGGRWSASTLRNFLVDRVYCGDYRFNRTHAGKFHRRRAGGQIVKTTKVTKVGCKTSRQPNPECDWVIRADTHEALVSRDLFLLAQAKLSKNADRKASTKEMRGFAFLRLLVCSHCGAFMTAQQTKRLDQAPRYYCGSNHRFGTCRGYSVDEKVIMKVLVDTLEAKFLDPVQLKQLEREAKVLEAELLVSTKPANHRATISKLNASITNAVANLALVPQNRVQGILDTIADWEIEKAKLEQEMAETGVCPTEELHQTIKYIKEFIWAWRESMLRDDMSSVYHLLRQAISKVDLRFETVTRKVRPKHHLAGGTVYFLCGKPVQFTDPTSVKPRDIRDSESPPTSNTRRAAG